MILVLPNYYHIVTVTHQKQQATTKPCAHTGHIYGKWPTSLWPVKAGQFPYGLAVRIPGFLVRSQGLTPVFPLDKGCRVCFQMDDTSIFTWTRA